MMVNFKKIKECLDQFLLVILAIFGQNLARGHPMQKNYSRFHVYPPGQKCFPTNRYFRSGRVIRLLVIQGELTSTFSPVAKQLFEQNGRNHSL